MTIKFFSQSRIIRKCPQHGTHPEDWADNCVGHSSFDEAVTCHELLRLTMEGKLDSHELVDPMSMALAQLLSSMLKADGATFEHRLVKRTIEEEVVDA